MLYGGELDEGLFQTLEDESFASAGCCESDLRMAPPWGLPTPRAPKELFNYFLKVIWSRNMWFSYEFPLYFACAKL